MWGQPSRHDDALRPAGILVIQRQKKPRIGEFNSGYNAAVYFGNRLSLEPLAVAQEALPRHMGYWLKSCVLGKPVERERALRIRNVAVAPRRAQQHPSWHAI